MACGVPTHGNRTLRSNDPINEINELHRQVGAIHVSPTMSSIDAIAGDTCIAPTTLTIVVFKEAVDYRSPRFMLRLMHGSHHHQQAPLAPDAQDYRHPLPHHHPRHRAASISGPTASPPPVRRARYGTPRSPASISASTPGQPPRGSGALSRSGISPKAPTTTGRCCGSPARRHSRRHASCCPARCWRRCNTTSPQ